MIRRKEKERKGERERERQKEKKKGGGGGEGKQGEKEKRGIEEVDNDDRPLWERTWSVEEEVFHASSNDGKVHQPSPLDALRLCPEMKKV